MLTLDELVEVYRSNDRGLDLNRNRNGLRAVLERLAQEYDRLNYHECGEGWTPRWLRCIKDGLNVDAEPDIEAAKEALAGAQRLSDDGGASYKAMKLALDAVYDALNGRKR